MVDQTRNNFKIDFNRAYRERRTIEKLSEQASASTHFGANYIATKPETLSTLTNATIKTGSNVLNLAHENATLREQVAALLDLVASLEATVKLTNEKLEAFMIAQNGI